MGRSINRFIMDLNRSQMQKSNKTVQIQRPEVEVLVFLCAAVTHTHLYFTSTECQEFKELLNIFKMLKSYRKK